MQNCAFTGFFRCFCLFFSRVLPTALFQRRLYRCQFCGRAAFCQLNVVGLMRFQGGGRTQDAALLIAQYGVTAFQCALRVQRFQLRLPLLQAGLALLMLLELCTLQTLL